MKCRNLVFQLDGTIWRTGALGLLPLKRHPMGHCGQACWSVAAIPRRCDGKP